MEKEFHPGMPPVNPNEEAAGLKEAIEATKRRIDDYKADNADVSGLEIHLKSLEQRLEATKKRT